MIIEMNWTDFKAQVNTISRVRYKESDQFYIIDYRDDIGVFQTSVMKDAGADQVDFETNYKPFSNVKMVKPSIRVQMAKVQAATVSGVATCELTIPAERWLSGGSAWFTSPAHGDYVKVEIHHPVNGKVGSFTDEAIPAGNQGWFLPTNGPANIGTIISDDPSKLSAGLILKIIGTKASGEDTLYTNLLWGYKV